MASYFSDNVIEPVIIVDVLRDHGEKGERVTKRLCSNSEQVEWAVKETHDQDLHVRFISICQRNSWRPLQITQDMFEGIVKHHGLNQSAYELSSCFYTRNLNREEAFCVPLSLARTGSSIDISYTMRYPEFKAHENRWTQRQTGIYHRFNEDTGQHFILLISPLPNSLGHRKIEEQLLNFDQPFPMDDLWVHSVLFSNYLPPWRQYMAWLENLLLPITNLSLVAEINRETRVKYDHLNTVYDLNNRLVQIPTLFHHSSDTLEGLLHCSGRSGNSTNPATQKLENCRRQAASYSRTAAYLQQRAQTTAELLFETLSLRDQTVTKIQTETMTNMSRSAYCIAIMGLFYLPTTLVAVSLTLSLTRPATLL
ncbi:hypothetical protein F4823DRAFT_387152 [Ustulina deusta]|nr:hypothetical protein F4823DRAFT_387152 [Ustulina deusta]